MLLQKEKQSIEEIGKKDKKIYERRKVSLSNIYDLLFPQKSRKYFRTNAKEHIGEVSSVKVSFCTSFRGKIKKGSLAVETALVLQNRRECMRSFRVGTVLMILRCRISTRINPLVD